MIRPIFPRTVSVIAAVLCMLCSFVRAQQAEEPSPKTALDEAALKARAVEVRQTFVHRFGTQAEIAYFDHPHQKGPRVAMPKPSKDGGIDAETIAAIDSYTASGHDPTEIYDAIVIRMIMKETYPDGFNHASGVANRLMKDAKYAAFFESQISETAARNTLRKATAAAEDVSQMFQEEQLAAGRAAEVDKIMSTVLTPSEMELYRGGDYKSRARLFFKAGRIVLKQEQVPNAFVIMLCDPSDFRRLGGLKEFGRGDIYSLYPDEATEQLSTEPKMWTSLAHIHSRFMQDGADAFITAPPFNGFLSKFSQLPADPYDLSTPFVYEMMLSTLGPSGKQQYRAASTDEKETMKKTAKAMYTATDVLIGTYVGQE